MGSGLPSAGSRRVLVSVWVLSFGLLGVGTSAVAGNEPPGGFIERADSTTIRALWTPSQIQSFLPPRGKFTFPAPYGTAGVRLTNPSDCGGTDCLNYVGYSYWRNINNHVGSDTMFIFLGLDRNRGGAGPSLFSYNKISEEVKPLGPLFDAASPYSWRSGEGWYFSAAQASRLYLNDGPRLLRYDVITKTFETVFDAATQFGANKYIWQAHSSNDDQVHSATLRESGTWATLGCLVYREDTRLFSYYPTTPAFDECQVDKSGRWLVIKDNVDGIAGGDNRIIDLQTGVERILLDQNGAGGHSDNGYGYMIANDNWNALPGAVRVWDFSRTPLEGPMVFHTTSWASDIGHISHSNAKPGIALSQQYACGGGVQPIAVPRQNEIVCFRLDVSQDVLVVTQNMTALSAPGGGDEYGKSPKGNLDVSGSYFVWTSNMGGNRLDAFIVKIPTHLLTGSTPDTTAPTVSINEPASTTSLNGLVAVSAAATDDVGVTSVQFSVDQVAVSEALVAPPYAILWDTATVSNGSHAITAVARDGAGNSRVSTPVVITVDNPQIQLISAVGASSISSSGALIGWATSILSNSQVDYGPTVAYGLSTTLGISFVSAHSQQLVDLAPATLYHYRVKSRDIIGQLAVSNDFTFTTLASTDIGLVTHLNLDEGAGIITHDWSGNNNSGTLMNGTAWGTGSHGQAAAFDGVDDYVVVPHRSILNAFPLTVSVWFKTSTTTGLAGVVNKYVAGAYNGYQVFFKNGTLCAWYMRSKSSLVFDGSGCTMATPGYNDDAWHQAVLVVDASAGGRLYVDGVQTASQPWTGIAGRISTIQDIHLGHYPGADDGGYLAGSTDELRIYNRALSAEDVWQLYSQERPINDVIFKDGFETGTVARWSAISGTPSQLNVTAAAAMAATSSGLEVLAGEEKNAYLQDDTPADENRYRARFYLDPNGFDPGEATGTFRTRIFSGLSGAARQLISIVLKRRDGQYWIMGSVLLDDLTQVDTPFFPLTNERHSIELDWRQATALGANDGAFAIWIDGSLVGTLTGLSNAAQGMDIVRIGAFGLKAGSSGSFYWDEFESRRETYIGPLPWRP